MTTYLDTQKTDENLFSNKNKENSDDNFFQKLEISKEIERNYGLKLFKKQTKTSSSKLKVRDLYKKMLNDKLGKPKSFFKHSNQLF